LIFSPDGLSQSAKIERMKIRKSFVLCLIGLAALVLSLQFVAASADVPPVSPVHVTPPAPVFDDAKRLAELAGRRKQVADQIGPKAMLIMFSAELRVYTNDVEFPFRQENNLFYLTNLNQKGATLVMMPGTQLPEILFLPRRNAAAESWTGHMYSAEEAARLSGVKEIWALNEFEPFMKAVRNKQPYSPKPENVLRTVRTSPLGGTEFSPLLKAIENQEASLCLVAAPERGESREYRQEQRFANDWRTVAGVTIKPVGPIFAAMRAKKSPMELALLQHAIDISIEAHERAWMAAANAKWEYEIDAEVARVFKLRNADSWGYPDIVGCGANATTLHYEESQSPCKPGDLLLMDVGAEYGHYSADVTRTTPINGKFSPAQAAIYQIVYDAQEAAAKAAKPGANLSDAHRASVEVIKAGLLKLGLITDAGADSGQYRMWFIHQNGHWLGMNVHDVSAGGRFEPGMTFTNEPGIYIRPDALDNLPKTPENQQLIAAIKPAFEKYKGIGVRIEDDMLITPEGVKWMTAALPRSIADIEAFIARARRVQR
jgi:Xaa-Pro aminopeptidase